MCHRILHCLGVELHHPVVTQNLNLVADSFLHGESFNFGPHKQKNRKVIEILSEIKKNWNSFKWKKIKKTKYLKKESKLLRLNCSKSNKKLNWKISLGFKETIKLTLDWYKSYYSRTNKKSAYELTSNQIKYYEKFFLRKK